MGSIARELFVAPEFAHAAPAYDNVADPYQMKNLI